MRIVLTIYFMSVLLFAHAQEDVEIVVSPQHVYDSIREQYITRFPDHFFIYPVLKQRRQDFEMQNLPGNQQLTYKSNKPYSFGVGMYLFELGFELAFAIPLDEQSKRIYGESDASDIQLNVLSKKWGLDLFRQKYSGFYIVDPNQARSNTPYQQRPDIETRNFGITGHYIFNNKKFSFRSAFNFVERQLRSAGSFVVFGSISSFRVAADSAIIGQSYENVFGANAQIENIRTTILAVAPGYTYSLIYKGFFLNGTLALGPAHNWLAYESEGGGSKDDINFSAFVTARLSLGYNGDRMFGGLSFVNQGRNTKFENLELTSSNSTFKILFGYRFKEFGFLKKRVSDIPREILN